MERQIKVNLVCHHKENDEIIPWECSECHFKGEWRHCIKSPNWFVRLYRAIKTLIPKICHK